MALLRRFPRGEGSRALLGRLPKGDCPPGDIHAGMRVEATFVPVSDAVTLVKFRRAAG